MQSTNGNNSAVEKLPWFHPNIQRHHAEAMLIQNGSDGSYLLRPSASDESTYSLSVKSTNSVKHFQVHWDGTHFTFGMGRFANLSDFIEHFENKPLVGGESGVLTVLKHPYPRDVSEPINYETVRVHAEWGIRPSVSQDSNSLQYSINSKEGYLTKLGHVVKNWKTRWFVLVRNELKYYKTKGGNIPIKIIDLQQCVEAEEDFSTGKKNCFRIVMPGRTYLLYATTASEKQEWIEILQWKLKSLKEKN